MNSLPPSKPDLRSQLQRQIAELETRLTDLQNRLPAHSIPPAMLATLDDLDEQLVELRARLATLDNSG